MIYNIPDKNVAYIAKARELYKNRDKYAYLYGAKGQYCTSEVFEQLWAAELNYFKKYTAQQKAEIKAFCVGKIVIDCSGFINLVTGRFMYSTAYMGSCKNVTTPDKTKDGDLLYTTFGGKGRHIALDIGHGFFMHVGKEYETISIGVIEGFGWEKGGTLE